MQSPSDRLVNSRAAGWLRDFVAFSPICSARFLRATWFVYLAFELIVWAMQVVALLSYGQLTTGQLTIASTLGTLFTVIYPLLRLVLVRILLEMAAVVFARPDALAARADEGATTT
jgi:hypothetical protein